MKKMNLPNKLTIFRIILIVPFVLLLLGQSGGWGWYRALFGGIAEYVDYIALAIFIIASLTDLIDGKIARKYNLVTNFGKFMDPLADKLLVSAAMIALVELRRVPAWIVILIISREFIISGFRLVAADNGVVIAASYWGEVQDDFPDGDGVPDDRGYSAASACDGHCYVDCAGADAGVSGGLSDEE